MYVWAVVNTISMIEMMPLLNIKMPPLVFKIFDGLRVSEYDFLPFDDWWDGISHPSDYVND